MPEPALLREENVELSVMRWITTGLPSYGYVLETTPGAVPSANVYVRSAFPTPEERAGELSITTLAFGFNIDDGGTAAELGSNLTRYVHTLMCWTFATEPRFGRRVAQTVKNICRKNNDIIPLLDFNAGDPAPTIDGLNVLRSQVRHQVNQSPRPWDRFVWTTSISVQDIAYPE